MSKAVIEQTLFCLLVATAVLAEPPVITQQVTPGTMSYQGRLQTTDGTDYTNGVYTVDFRLYDAASSGEFLWGATYKPYVNNGFFSVILGQTSVGEAPIEGATYPNVDDFWKGVWIAPTAASKQRFLGITVHQNENNQDVTSPAESFPRQELLASPFAIQSQYARQASGDFSVPGDLTLTGSISNPNGDLYVTDRLHVEDDLVVNGGHYMTIGSAGTMTLPEGEPESSDMVVGNDLYVDDTMQVGSDVTLHRDLNVARTLTVGSHGNAYPDNEPGSGDIVAGDDILANWDIHAYRDVYAGDDVHITDDLQLRDKLIMNYGQSDEHIIEHVVEAPASGVRIVAGMITSAGYTSRDIGGKYTVSRKPDVSAGAYLITFSPAFEDIPVVVACNGTEGNAVDNFVRVTEVTASSCVLDTRDDSPSEGAELQDAYINFIAVGY